MSTARSGPPAADSKTNQEKSNAYGPNGVERRRRKRAKISASVRVRTTNSPTPFEEVCKSVDVSRDGLFLLTAHAGYWKGQPLEVTFPYSTEPNALNQAQAAEIIRVVEQDNGKFGIGVQFATAKRASQVADPAASGGAASAGGGQKPASVVLAIEPDKEMADAMRSLLQNEGYTVLIVQTGQAALDVLKTTVPVVFVTEEDNADMSGHDLCAIIKRNERLQQVPIILLTEAEQSSDNAPSRETEAVVCMTKPFTAERLSNVIRLIAPPPSQRSVYGARLQPSAVERVL
jgi:CheY-like chemotaxis protein